MFPAAAVSGWYFAHPQAQYFAVGKIDKDQVERYSQRKGQEASVSERWLAPNLATMTDQEGDDEIPHPEQMEKPRKRRLRKKLRLGVSSRSSASASN